VVLGWLRKWFSKLAREVRGNALWDGIKLLVTLVAGLVAGGYFRWMHSSLSVIFFGAAAGAAVPALWFVLVAYRRKNRGRDSTTLIVRLVSKSEVLKSCHYRIEIENVRETPVQNVKVKLISISPKPKRLDAINVPITLQAEEIGAINPHAKGYFDFLHIDIEPGRRVVSLEATGGEAFSFEAGLYEMLGEGRMGFLCDVRISALDLPESKVLFKFRLEARAEEALGLTPIGGYSLEITSDEAEAEALQVFKKNFFGIPFVKI
jgi:hypothetical protein